MSHPAYKPPLRFVLRLRLQKGGGGVFAGHYSSLVVSSGEDVRILWIVAKDGSPDFGTGIIFDIFQSFGTTPLDREHSNMDW